MCKDEGNWCFDREKKCRKECDNDKDCDSDRECSLDSGFCLPESGDLTCDELKKQQDELKIYTADLNQQQAELNQKITDKCPTPP